MSTPNVPSARTLILLLAAVFLLGIAAFPAARIVQKYRARQAAAHAPVDSRRVGDALALAEGWLHGRPDSSATGPIVVVVWNDTDPTSLHALATAAEWSAAYARWGIRVVGVHEPDFAFATDSAAAGRASRRVGAAFPIALDPAGQVRTRLGAGGRLPVAILANAAGEIRTRVSGLPDFHTIESQLRRQIVLQYPDQRFPAGDPPGPTGVQTSNVIYLGTGRVREGPLAGVAPGVARTFTAEFRYQIEGSLFVPYPVGRWTSSAEGVTSVRGGAGNLVALRYVGGSLDAVISPPPGQHARLWVLLDEAYVPENACGADTKRDAGGISYVDIDEPRLYEIARGPGKHVVKLSPDAPGITLHSLVVDPTVASVASH